LADGIRRRESGGNSEQRDVESKVAIQSVPFVNLHDLFPFAMSALEFAKQPLSGDRATRLADREPAHCGDDDRQSHNQKADRPLA
jgi:hypothetical protein